MSVSQIMVEEGLVGAGAGVGVALRRTDQPEAGNALRYRRLVLDDATRQVTYDGPPAHLSPTEYKLLRLLLQHNGRVLPRSHILEQVWGPDFAGEPTVVESFISRVRKKVDPERTGLIRTVHGVGYRLGDR